MTIKFGKQQEIFSVSSSLLKARKSPLNYYHNREHFPSIEKLLGLTPMAVAKLPYSVVSVMQVVATYSMRISELLSLQRGNHLGCNRFYVCGSKGGADYTVYLPGAIEQMNEQQRVKDEDFLFETTYKFVWTKLKGIGYGTTKKDKENKSVTHYHRTQIANRALDQNQVDKIGAILHHKNSTSIEHYLQ